MSLEEAPHISQSERSFSGRTRRLLDGPFSTTVIRFLSKVCALRPEVWKCDRHKPRYGDWRALAWALTISSIGILVRSGNHVLAFLRFPSLPRYRRGMLLPFGRPTFDYCQLSLRSLLTRWIHPH